jgi:fatty-acid desaturase
MSIKSLVRSNTIYLPWLQIILSALAIIGVCVFPSVGMFCISLVLYALIGCFGISIGYHRYLSHKSFTFKKSWLQWPCIFLGCLAGTGSPIGWVAVHREHHRHSDRTGDPHSPHTIGYKSLLANYQYEWNKWPIRDLISNPTHRFIHDYYFILLAVWIIAWAIIGLPFLIYVVILPMVLAIWASTISNYINHKFGYKNYKTIDESGNCWYTALLTFGEGWHNNHHARPKSYRFGQNWWELDLGAFLIERFFARDL